MKQLEFLFDENISTIVKEHFTKKGFKCEAVKEIMEGAKDSAIGRYARKNKKVIVTLDKDFGEIFFNMGISVVLLRLRNALPERIIFVLEKFFRERPEVKEKDLPRLFVLTEKKMRERAF